MNIEFNQKDLCLKRRQVVKVRDGIGHSIVCDSGSVWVTQEGDPRDIVLGEGEAFTLDRSGTALVLAFESGAISVKQDQAQTGAVRLARLLKSALSGARTSRGAAAC